MGMSNSSNMMTISSNGVALNSDLTVYNGTLRATNIYSASTMNVSAQSTMTFEINANTGNGNTTQWFFKNWNNINVMYINQGGNGGVAGTWSTGSDDRIKTNETFISNASETLCKLRPQNYMKWSSITIDSNSTSNYESGLIAQEIFYDAPELRHLVTLPSDHNNELILSSNNYTSTDPSIDPNYQGWGTETASVNYIGLIPWLIQGFKEKNEEIQTMKSEIQALQSRLAASPY